MFTLYVCFRLSEGSLSPLLSFWNRWPLKTKPPPNSRSRPWSTLCSKLWTSTHHPISRMETPPSCIAPSWPASGWSIWTATPAWFLSCWPTTTQPWTGLGYRRQPGLRWTGPVCSLSPSRRTSTGCLQPRAVHRWWRSCRHSWMSGPPHCWRKRRCWGRCRPLTSWRASTTCYETTAWCTHSDWRRQVSPSRGTTTRTASMAAWCSHSGRPSSPWERAACGTTSAGCRSISKWPERAGTIEKDVSFHVMLTGLEIDHLWHNLYYRTSL